MLFLEKIISKIKSMESFNSEVDTLLHITWTIIAQMQIHFSCTVREKLRSKPDYHESVSVTLLFDV